MPLEEKILRKIRPTLDEEKRISSVAEELLNRARNILSEMGVEGVPVLVGSVAKGTFLRDPDIDIFIRFPVDTPKETLELKGLEIGKKMIPDGEENYAEHPYIHGTYLGFEVDVVPCYRVEDGSRKMSAVDRTPFHTEYIKNNIKEWQKDEVRLLKSFMKGIGVYGAEAETEGFSGYLVELLILYYGSFLDVLRGSQGWKRGIRLSLETDKGNRFDDPLIFIDPVDPRRNVASALSVDSFALFIHASHEYLRKEDERFFFPRERFPASIQEIKDELRNKGTELIGFEINRPDIVPDVLFPQVKKARRTISQRLNDAEFSVMNSTWHLTERTIAFIYELEVSKLPSMKNHYGPPVWHKNSEDFLRKWENSKRRIEMGRWVVQIKRESHASAYLEKIIPETNIGKDLTNAVKEGYRILSENDIIESYPMSVTELLFPLFPWEF